MRTIEEASVLFYLIIPKRISIVSFLFNRLLHLNFVQVSKGNRIAQLILERISTPEVVEVDNLDSTTRGSKGFGSTGC
jgi:dUTPase